jgi:diamine N-acetyltransferase
LPDKLSHLPIEGAQVRIRLLEERDLEQIRIWRNQDHIRKWFNDSRVIEPEQQRLWYERYRTLTDDYLYIVESRELDWKPIGQIGICRVDLESKSAEYGRMIAGEKSVSKKGHIYEASALLFDFWHKKYDISKFWATIKADNERSIHVCTLLGFLPGEEVDGQLYMSLCLEVPEEAYLQPALRE